MMAFGVSVAFAVAGSGMASASQSFGTLSYPSGSGSTEIPFQWSGGDNDNTNFLFTNNQVNGSWLTVGLRASPYYTGENGYPNYVGINTFEVQAGTTVPVANPPSLFDPNAPRWGFNWSISMDGNRSNAALTGLWWSMRITGPNSSGGTGNWGTQAGGMVNLGGGPVNGTNYSQSAWQLGYNFFPLSSQNTPGVGIPGLWNGLQFSPNALGSYQFTIDVRQGQYGSVVGSTTMTVSVVPAPGALALLGAAGFVGSRRRR
jgi:MYXO-CTERM domain-containing protein